jgi:hypothetical protein
VSFRSILLLILFMSLLFLAALFNLYYPQGVEDFLINQEWKSIPSNQLVPISQSHLINEIGRFTMKQSSVLIVGVGRDISDRLKSFLPQVESLASYFNSSHAIFVEGDSADNSNGVLKKWALKSPSNRTVVTVSNKDDLDTIGVFSGQKLSREGRLSIARNHVLSAVKELMKNPALFSNNSFPAPSSTSSSSVSHLSKKGENSEAYKKWDYIIMVDMDVIGWSVPGIENSFGQHASWDVICANGILLHGMYRDTYAYRDYGKGIDTNHHKGGHDHLLYNISASEKQQNRNRVRVSQIFLCPFNSLQFFVSGSQTTRSRDNGYFFDKQWRYQQQ